MVISGSTQIIYWIFHEWLLHVQDIHPKDEVRLITRHGQIFYTISQNALHVNNRRHHKGHHRYRKALEKPTQAKPIEEIGDRKCAALQQMVKTFSEKKEMTR